MIKETIINDRGIAMLETAIVLPVLLLLVLAIIDFSNILYQQSVYSAALRKIIRTVSVARDIPVEDETLGSDWDNWALDNVITPFKAPVPHELESRVESLEPQTGTLYDTDGRKLGCGIRVSLTASVVCISCNLLKIFGASSTIPYNSTSIALAEGLNVCDASPL